MSLPTTSNVKRPLQHGYGVRIDERYYRLSVSKDTPLDIITAPLQAPAVNTATSAEEIRNEFGEIFSRSDFTGGEGLDFAHRPSASDLDRTRFWDSKHIDISNPGPGELAKIALLPPTANIDAQTESNLHLAYDGTDLFLAEGVTGNARRCSDPTASSPGFSNDSIGASAEVSDLTSLGSTVYAAAGASGIRKRSAGSWASFSSTHTVRVWGVKRQLLAASTSDGSELSVVTLTGGSAGAHTALVPLSAGLQWRDVADCGQAILACADDGAIYALGFTDAGAAGGTLELKAQTPVGGTEVPYAVGFDGRFVYYTTREATPAGAIGRFYRASLTDAYTLDEAQLLRQWGDQTTVVDQCPRRIIATRDAVFTGVLEDDGAFLWRYDRATSGLTRHLDLGDGGIVVDMLVIAGRLFASVAGHGLRREGVGTYEADGYLIGPLADFFTAASKSWAGALLEHDEVADGTRIELYYTTDPSALTDPDSLSWVRAKQIIAGVDTAESPLVDVHARYLAGMVKLFTVEPAVSPSVRSFSFRAYPGDGDTEITMYVAVSDTIERPGFRRQRVRGYGDEVYAQLKGREGSYAEVEVLRTGDIYRGVVMQIGTRLPAIARRGPAADVAAVKFRGRRVVAVDFGGGLWGTGPLGTFAFGGQEVAA